MAANVQLPGFDDASPVRQNSAIRQLADQVNTLAPIDSPVFTGDPQAPTPSTADNDTSIATTAYVKANLANYAPLASPALTGNPTAPTPSPGDNDTSIATTAFVTAAVAASAYSPPSIADQRIMANISGGSAAPSANELSAIIDDIIGTTQGAILYRNASAWVKLDPGTSGQYLKTNGAAANPAWADVSLWSTSIKGSDQSRTSSAAFVDVTDLTFAVAANTTYAFEFCVIVSAGAGGYQIAVNGPTLTALWYGITTQVPVTAYDTTVSTGTIAGNRMVVVAGRVRCSASGTFAVRMRQDTSNAAATTVVAGSFIKWKAA